VLHFLECRHPLKRVEGMRNSFGVVLVSLIALIGWAPVWGQEVAGLQVSHSTIAVGEELTIEVAIKGLTSGNRCGLRVEFGNQESEEFRLGMDGQGASTVVIKRRAKTLGPMTIKAFGKFLPRGLNSLAACGNREFSAKVDVVVVQAQTSATQGNRRTLDQELERLDQKVSGLERRIGDPQRAGTGAGAGAVDDGSQMIMPLPGSTATNEPAFSRAPATTNASSSPTAPETPPAASGAARFLLISDPLSGRVKAQLTVATPFVCVLMANELRKTYAERLRQSIRGLAVADSETMARDLASCTPVDHSLGMRFRTRVRLPDAGIEYDLLAFTREVCMTESPEPKPDTQVVERCTVIR
jgi:hypothetical protein